MNREVALKFCREHGIRYVLALFVDIHGSAKAKAVAVEQLDMVLHRRSGRNLASRQSVCIGTDWYHPHDGTEWYLAAADRVAPGGNSFFTIFLLGHGLGVAFGAG